MSAQKLKVLYIAGYGRSGTTILDNVLGQVDGFFTAGELRYVWDRGVKGNWLCGCGKPFRGCPFWNTVFREAYGGMDEVSPEAMCRYRHPLLRAKHRLLGSISNAGEDSGIRTLGDLYDAIARVIGCDVVIDSSKWASYGHTLGSIPSVKLYVVHLVRDPRAVAFSWMRTRKYEPNSQSQVYIPKHSVLRTSLEWIIWNFWEASITKIALR